MNGDEIEDFFTTFANYIVENTLDRFYTQKKVPISKNKQGDTLRYSTAVDSAKVEMTPSIERPDSTSTRIFIYELTDERLNIKSHFTLRFTVIGDTEIKIEDLS
jgi:hypothetical protein